MIPPKLMDSAACALLCLLGAGAFSAQLHAAPKPKVHTVNFGSVRKVPYSVEGDPAGNNGDENELKIRPLLRRRQSQGMDYRRSPRRHRPQRRRPPRASPERLAAQPTKANIGSGSAAPGCSSTEPPGKSRRFTSPTSTPQCRVSPGSATSPPIAASPPEAKQLYAVVAQVAGRKPLLMKKISAWDLADHPTPACAPATWQREPLKVTFTPTKAGPPVSYDLVGLSAVLVEDGDESDGEN